jgi:hypothetical protein
VQVGRNILKAPVTGKERMKLLVSGIVPIEVMAGTLNSERLSLRERGRT